MAVPERDTVYSADTPNRTVYTRESSATGWFVGIIVALALLAIGYLVFSANSGPSTTSVDVNNTPAVTAPTTDTGTTPMTDTNTTPMAPAIDSTVTAPAADVAPVTPAAPADTMAPAAPAAEAPVAPAVQ